MIKKTVHILITTTVFLMLSTTTHASSQIAEKCNYEPVQGENPDLQTMNCLLTETALDYGVPPEIVKAIAEQESSGWKHFDEQGNTIESDDGGIGIMQITNKSDYDEERLESDILYNINAGVETLNQMFERSDLPRINDHHQNIIEHWYFAVMAYNGTKPVNSPIVKETGQTNHAAYQEHVFKKVEDYSLTALKSLPFKSSDFKYDPQSTENINFVKMHYAIEEPLTNTKYNFKQGQTVTVTVDEVNVRQSPGGAVISELHSGEIATIAGEFEYDINKNSPNHFVWYPIELSNGTKGYIASSYLKLKFRDLPNNHYSEKSVYYLAKRGILLGKENGDFGYNEYLPRWQAALLLNRANHVSLENRPDPNFKDVNKDYNYYNHIAAAVDENYFDGFEDNTFRLSHTLKRSEMAKVLDRIYKFPNATSKHPFIDIPEDKWYAEHVANIYAAGITEGTTKTTFGPGKNISREQFAVFLARSIQYKSAQ